MTSNMRLAALVWAALAASGATSLYGCGQSNCTEKATCPDTSHDGGDAGSLDATTGGDALVGLDAHVDASSDGSVTDVAVTDASDGGDNPCGTLGLACCADAGCGGSLTCGDGGACVCPSGSKLCDATCIPSTTCCTSGDCTGGETCQTGTCACPTGQTLCNGACKTSSGCCTNSDCGTGGQCNGGTCGCQVGYRLCGTACIPSASCCSSGDCMTTTTNTCSAGTCTCNGSIACAGGQVCTGAGCACPSNERLCNGVCLPSGNCCTSSDCASATTNTCTGGVCTCEGLPACTGGEQCSTTGCACPGGDKLCGSTCIPIANCCTDNDCTSPPDVCHQSPGTCSSGGCSYTPVAPAPVRSCAPPTTGQTLNNVGVDGICIVTVYYCSASDAPFGQATPSGYANVPSNPAGCDYNGCSDAGADNCHENFCADALGNCNACP